MNWPTSPWTLLSVFIFVGMLQCILLFLLFVNKKKQAQHKFFLVFLGLLFYLQLEAFLIHSGWLRHCLFLMNTSTPFIFLLGPVLYFYLKELQGKSRPSKMDALHLLPFVAYFAYSFFFFLQPLGYKYNALIRSFYPGGALMEVNRTFSADPWNIQGWVVVEMLSLHLFVYAVFAVRLHQKAIQQKSFSQNLSHWAYFLIILFFVGALLLFFSQGGVINGEVLFPNPIPGFLPDIWGTIAAYLITLYLGWNTQLFKAKAPKYQKSSLPKALLERKSALLRRLVEEEQLYLNPEFSLALLAKKSGIPKHQISQILNEHWQCSFFELAHQYRIAEAKKRLRNPAGYIKMEQLAYELGYKSKSTFFIAFKKETQQTPSQFKKAIRASI